ncbi:MAG TPA: MotA/TolQ/ExbB proton channel family protein [Planctomycetota bacterium]|nr:MotA/TolQ/ExbB proton channel family protein [Planctomycetota bacterium]
MAVTSIVNAAQEGGLDSLYDLIVSGGPIMWPIAFCSVVALGYSVARWIRMRSGPLGTARVRAELLAAADEGGPERALELCARSANPLARTLQPGLERWDRPRLEHEKAVEDAGSREVRRLTTGLRPLVVVAGIAPLLGLLGTVWGMILAFNVIAMQQGLGRPELLANGIAQALVTTAAGLAVAIPTQAVYYYLKGRIDRFVSAAEDTWQQLALRLRGEAGA